MTFWWNRPGSVRGRGWGLAAAALACVSVLSACGQSAAPVAVGTSAAPEVAAGPAGPGLSFRVATLDGAVFDAATLRGRPAVLWFWAPWCTICRAEAPTVTAVSAEFEGAVQVVGVAGQGEVAEMKGFVADTGTGALTHVADTDGAVWRAFGVIAQPAFAFVRPDGQAEVFVGALGEDALRERIQALVG